MNNFTKKIIYIFLIIPLLLGSISLPVKSSGGGVFYLKIKDVNNLLEISVMADSGSEPINAVGINLSYPIENLYLEDAVTTESFCEYFIENEIDNTNGNYKISCVTPQKDIIGERVVAKLYFKIINRNETKIVFSDDCKMLTADGQAANILGETIDSELIIN